MQGRRKFLQSSVVFGVSTLSGISIPLRAANDVLTHALGDTELITLSDGYMQLPLSFILPEDINAEERAGLIAQYELNIEAVRSPCTLTLWKTADRTILFDTGGGTLFMPTLGNLQESLSAAGVSPSDVTDVVFTHAHPDHLWGLIDDFDELVFPDASYHMNGLEWDYWRADDTLANTPEARQSFVVGAQNRMQYLEDRIQLFKWGDELLPGLEAVDTHGHTPGHTSFALHQNSSSVLVLGDALNHPVFSFRKPQWPSGSDQDPEQGIKTRLSLLDRSVADQVAVVGFHLPDGGYGQIERHDGAFRFLSDLG